MSTLKRPGVYVEERLLTGHAIGGVSTSTAVFISTNGRGPTAPAKVTSWTEYQRLFGGFGTNSVRMPHAAFQYFSNGGREAYFATVRGAGAAPATRTLADAAAIPANTLRVDAISPGTWGNGDATSNGLWVDVAAGSSTGLFHLIVKQGGTSDANIVERWLDLSVNPNSPRYAPAIVNASPGIGSYYITVTDLATSDLPPAAQTNAALTGGADGAAVAAADITAAIDALNVIEEPFNLNLPGVSDASVVNYALGYAINRGDVFVVVDPPENATPAAVITYIATLTQTSYGALYYPWIFVDNPASTDPNSSRLVPPGGAVLGQYARTDVSRGVFKAPAGIDTRIARALALERRLTNTDLDNLNVANVNAIRHIPGAGICIFGTRTLRQGRSDRYVPIRRTMIYLRRSLLDGTRFAVFEVNDERLWFRLRENTEQFLMAFWREGGLRGESPDQAFYVKCNAELNTPSVIANGEVRVEVGLALQYPAEFVVITLSQMESGGQAVEAA